VPKKHFNLSASSEISPIPSNYRSALKDPNWLNAMQEEFNALTTQTTWLLVPRLAGVNVVTGKWIFRHKYNSDGSLKRYKARWVVCGFTQQYGVDYEEMFSPVIKPSSIRVVLSIATLKDWSIHQLDVKNVFLHGNLSEHVYAQQPSGFVSSSHPDFMCKLKKNYTVLNKPLTLGFFGSHRFYGNLVFVAPNQIHRYLIFIVANPPPIFFYTSMILFLPPGTHLF
jgi:hypothetical protein